MVWEHRCKLMLTLSQEAKKSRHKCGQGARSFNWGCCSVPARGSNVSVQWKVTHCWMRGDSAPKLRDLVPTSLRR